MLCMGIGSTVECSFTILAPCFSLLAHPCTGTLNAGGAWLDTWHMCHIIIYSLIRCPNVSQFMSPAQSPGFTPTNDALLDLLLELLSWH